MGLCLLPLAKSCAYCRGLFAPGRTRARLKLFNRRGATPSAAAICFREKPPRSSFQALAVEFRWRNAHKYAQTYTLQEAAQPSARCRHSVRSSRRRPARRYPCVCFCAAAVVKGNDIQGESKFVTLILPKPVKRKHRPEALFPCATFGGIHPEFEI